MDTNTKIIQPGVEKFTLPKIPIFKGNGPWFSALSLLAFSVASIAAFYGSSNLPLWSRAPFVFTAIGKQSASAKGRRSLRD